jgi:hypothetical protein
MSQRRSHKTENFHAGVETWEYLEPAKKVVKGGVFNSKNRLFKSIGSLISQQHQMSMIHDKQMPETPLEFFCPITFDVMREPTKCRFGLSFERSAIRCWILDYDGTCPLTRRSLSVCDLVPNRALQSRIQAWSLANEAIELPHSLANEAIELPYSLAHETIELPPSLANEAIELPHSPPSVVVQEEEEIRPVPEERTKRFSLAAFRTKIWRLRNGNAHF